MPPRFLLPARLPIPPGFAGNRTSAFRHTSSSSTSRVIRLASRAEKPGPLEASVPVLWVACGAFIYTAFSRVDERSGNESVEKLLIV